MKVFRIIKHLFRYHAVIVVPTVLLLALCIVMVNVEGRIERACLKKGYPEFKMTWGGFGKSYCVRRVNQTDEVVPL